MCGGCHNPITCGRDAAFSVTTKPTRVSRGRARAPGRETYAQQAGVHTPNGPPRQLHVCNTEDTRAALCAQEVHSGQRKNQVSSV